jgi:hypothetical protein
MGQGATIAVRDNARYPPARASRAMSSSGAITRTSPGVPCMLLRRHR